MKVYKINDQKNIGVTIIYINSEVSEKDHENILKIYGISDIAFVFSKSRCKFISPKKFSSLYGATFFGIGDSDDEMSEVWNLLDYLHELTKYNSYSIVLQKDLGNIGNKELSGLKDLQGSLIESSVFTWRSLSNNEFQEIYSYPRKKLKIFGYSYPKEDLHGVYSKYTTEDLILFIRPISITRLKEIFTPEDIATFKGSGIKTMLSSIIPAGTKLLMSVCKRDN